MFSNVSVLLFTGEAWGERWSTGPDGGMHGLPSWSCLDLTRSGLGGYIVYLTRGFPPTPLQDLVLNKLCRPVDGDIS